MIYQWRLRLIRANRFIISDRIHDLNILSDKPIAQDQSSLQNDTVDNVVTVAQFHILPPSSSNPLFTISGHTKWIWFVDKWAVLCVQLNHFVESLRVTSSTCFRIVSIAGYFRVHHQLKPNSVIVRKNERNSTACELNSRFEETKSD